jgi:hypothetical protein
MRHAASAAAYRSAPIAETAIPFPGTVKRLARRAPAAQEGEQHRASTGRLRALRPRAAIRRYWLPNRSCSMPAAAKM